MCVKVRKIASEPPIPKTVIEVDWEGVTESVISGKMTGKCLL
jgi:hypothetical protein